MSKAPKLKSAAIFTFFLSGATHLLPLQAEADGLYFQLDTAARASDAVFSATQNKIGFGANYSSFQSGWSAGLNVTRDFTIRNLATVKVGPSFGTNSASTGVEIGGKIVVERFEPTDFGFVFLSGQYNSIENDWFALAQFGNGRGFSIDLTAGGSDTYSEQSVALNYRLGTGPAGLRAGYRFGADEVFVGLSVNTY